MSARGTRRRPDAANGNRDFAEAFARLRALAAPGADGPALAAGEPHPDAALLDALEGASRIRQLSRKYEAAAEDIRAACRRGLLMVEMTADQLREHDAMVREARALMREHCRALTRAGRIPARTGAGVYVKALAINECLNRYHSAPVGLAGSLARDLLALPEVRRALWPAAEVMP